MYTIKIIIITNKLMSNKFCCCIFLLQDVASVDLNLIDFVKDIGMYNTCWCGGVSVIILPLSFQYIHEVVYVPTNHSATMSFCHKFLFSNLRNEIFVLLIVNCSKISNDNSYF